jgi:hypothetical protein
MLKHTLLLLTAFGSISAQQPVAPTTAPVGPPRGDDKGDYNYTNSFELGYRFREVGGDLGMYRSTVNYGNGIRLLGSSFSVNSKDGHGHYFDQILLNTIGLGNDPYQAAILRIQKNSLYRYDMTWRLNDYFNPGLTVAGGLHLLDTVQRTQDHELLLLPQSKYRFRVGYAHNTQDGPSLTTAQEFDVTSVGLPVFMNVRRQWNEYRIGGDVDFAGFKFTLMHRWDYFKEDTPFNTFAIVSGPSIGVVSDPTVLQSFVRSAPVHGRSPGWLGNLLANHKRWAVNARGSYLKGHNDFVLGESAIGTDRFGAGANRQIQVQGSAQRPFGAGDLNLTFFPTDRITVINVTSFNSQHFDGPSSFTEVLNGLDFGTTVFFRYLGIRRIANSTDVNFRLNKWLGVYGGFAYTDRLVRTIESPSTVGSATQDVFDNTNTLKTGTVGFRLHPAKPLTVNLEAEIGRATNPFTPIGERNYHTINGRVTYRTRTLQLSTTYKQVYNINAPVPLSDFSSHSRNYTANASWSPQSWFSLDASYVKLHLDTTAGLVFFAGLPRPTRQTGISIYRSNIHAANLAVRIAARRWADLYFGYSITDDTGDTGLPPAPSPTTNPVGALFASVQTFPLTYQSPSARVSVRITSKMRWNVGYQYYNYHELLHLFGFNQNYRANTGFTSVLWSF